MIHWLFGGLATLRFELKRSLTLQRLSVATVLALFPPVMVSLIFGSGEVAERLSQNGEIVLAMGEMRAHTPFAIIFLSSLICLLSLLLWATPNVHSELEGRSWGFLSSRPGGRMSIFIGKFLSSVLVSYATSLFALALSVLITRRMNLLEDPQRLLISLGGIYLLACVVYGAVFSMLGTIFYKRAMVIAAGYLIGSEVLLASIPAVINKFTIRFHLQELGVKWIGFFLPVNSEAEYRAVFGEPMATWIHLTALASIALVSLLVGAIVITNRQYITSEEN